MIIYCREESMSYSSGLASFDVIGYTVEVDEGVARELLRIEKSLFSETPFPGTKSKAAKPRRRSRKKETE